MEPSGLKTAATGSVRRLHFILTLFLLTACLPRIFGATNTNAPSATSEPIVLFDLTYLFKLDLKDEHQLHQYWDEAHLVSVLEGLANRDHPRLFVRYLTNPDDFWWKQMVQPGGWLAGRPIVRIGTLNELLAHFRDIYHGAVVWDEHVPATANLASTIAGCDDLLPLRFDPQPDSLYETLTTARDPLAIKTRLLRDDGTPLFTGSGMVPGTSIASSGSAKCDAYLWLIENYVRTGRANPRCMGYYLDAYWFHCWPASAPENNTLCNQDYIIAHRGIMFDLGVWDDESPVDDPGQAPGTDAATLQKLLRAAYDQFHGNGLIHVAGFVPWGYKYTSYRSPTWFAGGHHDGVPSEWRFAEILSCFNAYMDADAIGLGTMANASFYQHYPLAAHYSQNPKPTRASLTAQGLLDTNGLIIPKTYVAFYVGDYDSAAWLYRMLPAMWRDPARGSIPSSWAFDPNLCERFPLGMVWSRENRSSNDWFVAGDSGAGYLNPGNLTPPRPYSGLPSGLSAWEEHCEQFYQQWDISLTGFIINGNAHPMAAETRAAYSRFSPDGIVTLEPPQQGMTGDMPYLQMRSDLEGQPADVAATIHRLDRGTPPRFFAFRTILKSPTWHAGVMKELNRIDGDRVKFVDLYSLLWLVHAYETNKAAYAVPRMARAGVVSATPNGSHGLEIRSPEDGSATVVEYEKSKCWLGPKQIPPAYVYFAVEDSFRQSSGGAVEIELEYLDAGIGDVLLQYDSTDANALLGGAYKSDPTVVHRANTKLWKTARFRVTDALFQGAENGDSDFRFVNQGDDLLIRAVRVRREASGK